MDMNNLYGWGMAQYLPYGDFKWEPNIDLCVILNTPDDSEIGYIVDCDLFYPDSVRIRTEDFPLCPEKRNVKISEFSKFQKECPGHPKYTSPIQKIILDVNNKLHYVTHYRNLKFYLKMGLHVMTINRVISFRQKPWLAGYITFNQNKRMDPKNKTFEKNFYKLMNNIFYGKTIEDVAKYRDFKVKYDISKSVRNPRFKQQSKVGTNLSVVEFFKKEAVYNKPFYLGFSILELSKLIMYKYYYETLPLLKKEYHLLYCDTDSFILSVHTDDVYEDLKIIEDTLDLTDNVNYEEEYYNIPNVSNLKSAVKGKNKKVIGKMKLEEGGKVLEEFIGIRSKCYMLKVSDHEDRAKLKNEACQKKSLEFYELTKDATCEHEDSIMNYNKKETIEAQTAFLDLEVKRIKGVARNVVAKQYTSVTFRNCIENGVSPEPKMQTTLVIYKKPK